MVGRGAAAARRELDAGVHPAPLEHGSGGDRLRRRGGCGGTPALVCGWGGNADGELRCSPDAQRNRTRANLAITELGRSDRRRSGGGAAQRTRMIPPTMGSFSVGAHGLQTHVASDGHESTPSHLVVVNESSGRIQ